MAKLTKITRAFNAGELSPDLDSRTDQAKYESGCKTLENFIPLIYGGVQRRPGLEFIAAAKDSTAANKSRLVSFEHSVDDVYVLEFANQVIRIFKDGALIPGVSGVADLSAFSNIIAHWKLDDDTGTSTVIDADGATHNGDITTVASATDALTNDVHRVGNVGTGSFYLGQTRAVEVGDSADFTFIEGVDGDFSVIADVFVDEDGENQTIISKWSNNGKREWKLDKDVSGRIKLDLFDQANSKGIFSVTNVAITPGWHVVCATYEGEAVPVPGGKRPTAANFIKIYIDGVSVAVNESNDADYVSMTDTASSLAIGAHYSATDALQRNWRDRIDNVSVHGETLTAANVLSLFNAKIATEIPSPYLTADLPSLKFENSADVMFITHPSYEDRRLSRFSDSAWLLEVSGIITGPFRDQNTDLTKTITSDGSAEGASVTLTAVGHTPFATSATAGHAPNGNSDTDKATTGTLFKLIHATGTSSIGETLDSTTEDAVTATLAVPKGITWDWTTNGTWGTGGPSTVVLERSYDSETTYETVHTVTSLANKNVTTSGTEDFADAIYRVRISDGTGTGDVSIQLSIRDTSHIGIVKITSVTNTSTAIGVVVKTLGATDPTHRWSEGSFSNKRGWPIDVTISSEERLQFAGNISEPLTTWGSVIGDFTDFTEGTDDDSAIQFTLVGSGQQNRIRWMVAKEALVLGTVGGEHILGASKDEEALTPTNVKAKLQTTYGSEDISAKIVNQAILFVQRGGKKIREFLYNFEADAHKADDLTVFANQITGDGIVDMAFQRTPDPILWCVRVDGQLAVLNYERDQNVFSWSRICTNTNLAGASTQSIIESVAVVFGGVRSEDEVWVSILRQIDGSDSRTIERFDSRELASAAGDWKFLDSYITDTGGDTTITGLGHLEGQTVQVLGDGLVQATKVVASAQITAAATAAKYQVGIGYTSTLIPMDIDLEGTGLGTTKRINRVMVNVIDTVGGEIGPDTSRLETISPGATKFTGHKEISIPGGYTRDTDITVRQTDPVPTTILSLTYDIGGSRD